MAICYIMVGLPGSGKSTIAARLIKEGKADRIISTDAIRAEINGNAAIQANGKLVFKMAYERLAIYLNAGFNVVFDATNLTRFYRDNIIKMVRYLKDNHSIIAISLMKIPIDKCIERDSKRERVVGEQVIRRMYSNYNILSFKEGFEDIWYVNEKGELVN